LLPKQRESYPATSESKKVSFNQLNRKTGHRIKYAKVDADTGEEVANDDIVKGYKVDTDTFIEVTKEELENVTLESTRTIEIDEFVDRSEIDPRYLFARTTCAPTARSGTTPLPSSAKPSEMNKVAIGRVVLTNREHIIALEPLDKGLMGTCCAILTKSDLRKSISTRSRTSKSPRTCSTWPSTSSTKRRDDSSRESSRIGMKQHWSNSST
jgi:Ku protein